MSVRLIATVLGLRMKTTYGCTCSLIPKKHIIYDFLYAVVGTTNIAAQNLIESLLKTYRLNKLTEFLTLSKKRYFFIIISV